MQQGITACAEATIDGEMVQLKDNLQRILHKWLWGCMVLPLLPKVFIKIADHQMHLQDYNSAEAMAFNGSEATTATIAVQGHHTQEGQLNLTSEPYPRASINS